MDHFQDTLIDGGHCHHDLMAQPTCTSAIVVALRFDHFGHVYFHTSTSEKNILSARSIIGDAFFAEIAITKYPRALFRRYISNTLGVVSDPTSWLTNIFPGQNDQNAGRGDI